MASERALQEVGRRLRSASRSERIVRVVGRYASVQRPEDGKEIEFDSGALRTLLPDLWRPEETINLFDPPWNDTDIAQWFLRSVRHLPNSFVEHERQSRFGAPETVREPAWSFASTNFVVNYEGANYYSRVAFTPDLRFYISAGDRWVRGSARFSPEAFRSMIAFVDMRG